MPLRVQNGVRREGAPEVERMKINVEIDVTPEEARTFLGLPDLEPMQQAILKDVQDRIQKNIARLEPEALMRQWFSLAPQGLDQVQKLFGNLASMATGRRKPAPKE